MGMARLPYQRKFLLRPILTSTPPGSLKIPCPSRTVRRLSTRFTYDADCVEEYWQRWIVNDSWTYTADLQPFLRSVPQSPSQRTLLVFYGLDTVANIVGISDFSSSTT